MAAFKLPLPLEVWIGLHSSAAFWLEQLRNPCLQGQYKHSLKSDREFLKKLKNMPTQQWQQLCDVTGWTALGAVALSWCEGATVELVLEAWSSSPQAENPAEEEERAAELFNSSLLPDARLSTIVELAKTGPNVWLLLCIFKLSGIKVDQDWPREKIERLNKNLRLLLF